MDDTTERTFHDALLICVECGEEFAFTAGEREFYAHKRLAFPKRCKPCRERRKATIGREREVGHGR